MLQLILSWAKFDAALTQFVLAAFGTSLDEGSLLLGNMQTRDKLDKLKALYKHHGMAEAAESIAVITKGHKHYVDVRNSIAHHACLGMYLPKGDAVMFSAGRIAPGNKGLIGGVAYTLEHMTLAGLFAQRISEVLFGVIGKQRRRPSRLPLAPPLFRVLTDHSLQKSGKGKRSKPHQGQLH
jgi:hypothetical protein